MSCCQLDVLCDLLSFGLMAPCHVALSPRHQLDVLCDLLSFGLMAFFKLFYFMDTSLCLSPLDGFTRGI